MHHPRGTLLAISFLLVLTGTLSASSWYYRETFTSNYGQAQTEWSNLVPYGRISGVLAADVGTANNSTQNITGGVLSFRMRPNDGGISRNGFWVGRNTYNTNRFTATAVNPVGIEVIRTYASLDFDDAAVNTGDLRLHCSVGCWLFQDPTPLAKNRNTFGTLPNQWETYPNSMEFANEVGVWGATAADALRKVGYFDSSFVSLNLTSAVRPDGRTMNITNQANFDWLLQTQINGRAEYSNIGFRMIHDGSYINFFINPDPDNNDVYPNEWCYVGQRQVVWNDNFRFMLSHAQMAQAGLGTGNMRQDVDWDDVLAKSASDTSVISVTPTALDFQTNTKTIVLKVSNLILAQAGLTNAGINMILITKPNQFRWPSNIALSNCVTVSNYYGDSAVKRGLLTTRFYPLVATATNFPGTGRCGIVTNGDTLTILLGDQITNMSVPDRESIYISMKFKTTNVFTNAAFSASVKAEQFESMAAAQKGRYSTCGWQKCTAIGAAATITALAGPADAFAAVDPQSIFQGPNNYTFTYYFSTSTLPTGRQSIAWAAIEIPAQFSNSRVTNFNSVLMGTNERALIKITNLTGTATNLTKNKVILLNYSGSKIASPDGLDVLNFKVIGSVNRGSGKWRSWVDGTSISGSSHASGSNINYPSQSVLVLGETPKANAEISHPSSGDPRILFNTITKNTLEYKIRNTSDNIDNKIYTAVITLPSLFTQVSVLSSAQVTNTFIKTGKIGGVTSITLFYGLGGSYIPPNNGEDRVDIVTWHNIPNGETTNVFLSAIVNNSNGEGFKAATISGYVNGIMITDPQPIGLASITPLDGKVWTSDTTNRFRFRLKNTAPDGKIYFAKIILPKAYFTNITSVNTTLLGTNFHTIGATNIFLNYNAAGTNISINALDDIFFTVRDKFTNSTPGSATLTCVISNLTKANTAGDLNPPDETRTVWFVPQDARVRSFITNNNIMDITVTTATLWYVFENYGDPGNRVNYAEGTFNGAGGGGNITAITKATSAWGGAWNITGLRFSKNGYGLPAGTRDLVKVVFTHNFVSETTRDVVPLVTVNTSVGYQAVLPSGKTNSILFAIPPPVGRGSVSPNVMFSSASGATNIFVYTVANDGYGNNSLNRAEIVLPTALQGTALGLASSWLASVTFMTTQNDRIIVDYLSAGKTLTAKSNDRVTFRILNSIASKSNVLFDLQVANNDGKGLYPTAVVSGGSKSVQVLGQPSGVIKSPSFIESASSTNTLVFRIDNPDTGLGILGSRIAIPTRFTVLSNKAAGSWPSAVYAVSNGWIWASYSANDIDPGGFNEITFRAVDTYSKTNTLVPWMVEVSYDKTLYLTASTNGGTRGLMVNFTVVNTASYLTPNQALVTSITNAFTYVVTNQGYGSNDLNQAVISYPTAQLDAVNVTSSRLAASNVQVNDAAGTITLRYDRQGYLPVGSRDVVSFRFSDTVSSETSFTLSCQVDNGLGLTAASTSRGSRVLNFILARIDSYIAPNAILTTLRSNAFTYRINNSGDLNPYYKVLIHVPAVFTNITKATSQRLGLLGISGQVSIITLRYTNASKRLNSGDFDVLTFTAFDSLGSGNTAVSWTADASNIGWNYGINATGGQSQSVNFTMPVASGSMDLTPNEIYTTSVTDSVVVTVVNAGDGSNDLFDLVLRIPSVFTNVTQATSRHLADQANIKTGLLGNITTLTLHYSADAAGLLRAGSTDTIRVRLTDRVTNLNNTSKWTCEVRNVAAGTFTRFLASVGGSDATRFVRPPSVVSSPATIDTTTVSNTMTVSFNNTGAGGTSGLRAVRLYPPAVITNIAVLATLASSVTNSGTWIEFRYSPVLDFGLSDDVLLAVRDRLVTGQTDAAWVCLADKGEGFKPFAATAALGFRMPAAKSSAWLTAPLIAATTSLSNDFTLVVRNDGTGSDRLDEVTVLLPSTFTNARNCSASGLSQATNIRVVSNLTTHVLLAFDYWKEAASIPVNSSATLRFTAFDRVTNTSQAVFGVKADNRSGANLQPSSVPSGLTATVSFFPPDYKLQVESVTPSVVDPTLDPPQTYVLTLKNTSTKNNLTSIVLSIPAGLTVTNASQIRSAATGSNWITVQSNRQILIDYLAAGASLIPDASDTITMTLSDTLTNGNATNAWFLNARFDAVSPPVNATWIAGSQSLKFQTPNAVCLARVAPDIVYTVQPVVQVVYSVSNAGTGRNYISELQLVVPGIFTNGLSALNAASLVFSSNLLRHGAIPTFNKATRTLSFDYAAAGTNLYPGGADTIVLNLNNGSTGVTNGVLWSSYARNGVSVLAASSDAASADRRLDVRQSTAKLSASVSPGSIYSTDLTNAFVFNVRNVGSAGDRISRLEIAVPPAVSAILGLASSKISSAYITNKGSILVFDYASAGYLFNDSTNDAISFQAMDTYTSGTATIAWSAAADFNNGLGMIPASESSPGSLKVRLSQPVVLCRADLLTPVIFTSESNVTRLSNIRISIQNLGTGANAIKYLELDLNGPYVPFIWDNWPQMMPYRTRLSNISPTNLRVFFDSRFGFAPIQAQETRIFNFSLVNYQVPDEHYNLAIDCRVRNTTNASDPLAVPSVTGDMSLDIKYPDITIYKPSIVFDDQANQRDGVIYTLYNSAEVHYEVLNKSPAYNISEVLIGFDFGRFTNLRVTNSFVSAQVTWPYLGSYIRILYQTNTPIPPNAADTVRLFFNYRQSTPSITMMTCAVRFREVPAQMFGRGDTNFQRLRLENAWWGQVRGNIFPFLTPVNIKLYDVTTRSQARGIFGEILQPMASDTSDGSFAIDVLPGVYNLKVYDEEGAFLSKYYVTNLTVVSNYATNVSLIYLLNAPLRSSDPDTAVVACYDDDGQSYLSLPSGSIGEDFLLNIYIEPMTAEEAAGFEGNDLLDPGTDTTGLTIFNFDMQDLGGTNLTGNGLKATAKLTLHYDSSLVTNKGWDEDTLSIFAWDEATASWIKIGGKLDPVGDTVTADVNFVNRIYAILPVMGTPSGKPISDVSALPNPFTPYASDSLYKTLRISFTVADGETPVLVNIFNFRGERVKKIPEITVSNGNATVWWDGRDDDGYLVAGGLYVYQIRAGKSVYSGVVLLAR